MASSQKQQGFRFKKINISFAALLVFAMCFFVSCGGGSSKPENGGDSVSNFGKLGGECYPNETCDKGLLCDTAGNICVEDPDNPTDTGSDKPGNQEKPDEQNNQNDQDKPVEQPDENHQENQNDQDTPVEQPDEDHQENQNDQDTPIEQPDQDIPETPDEHNDQDITDPQNDQGKCDPGHVWVDYSLDPWVQEEYPDKDYNNKCVACVELTTLVDQLVGMNAYCPGGDDLKGKRVLGGQVALCPEYTLVTTNFDDCVCTLGVPPPPKEDCHPSSTRKKPLIISPKVNVNTSNSSL